MRTNRLAITRLATWVITAAATPVLLMSQPVAAADNLADWFRAGDFGVSFRWRMEHVNQDPLQEKALGIPLRTRVNYASGDWGGFSLFAEYDHIFDFGVDTYNEGAGNTPTRGNYPVIADPSGGDFNQGYLQYKSAGGNRFRLGRQRIILDNARFVGNVGWRQNEQTYDALSFGREGLAGFNLNAAYIDQTNRIFGDDVSAGRHDMETWVVNVSRALGEVGKLTGYWYDIDNEDAVALSNRTVGLRFTGQAKARETALGYTLEYAYQEDSGDNPSPYDADYWRLDLSAKFSRVTLYGGYESLGGDETAPGQAFRTPLATLHAFNGWADKFLATPAAGLADVFAGLKGPLVNWSWNVLYHDFSAESGSQNFGSEIDASISRKFNDHFALLLKAAKFDTDSSAYGDTTKFWIQVSVDL